MLWGHVPVSPQVVTRRQLLQAALLLVLVGAAGWLYLAPQGGVNAVTALLSRDAAAPGAAPAPAPAPPRRVSEEPTGSSYRTPTDARLAPASRPAPARAVPSHPVEGELAGKRFRLERAQLESGLLRLRQLDPALELELVLPVNPWQVPAGRSFEVLAPEQRDADTPLVRVRVPGPAPQARAYVERYTLWLEFGRERDGALPGRLHLVLPDKAGSRVAGTFVAGIRGFRFVDGKPDLSVDSVGTLEYLALREILRHDPNQPLESLAFRDAKLTPGRNDAPATGYLEVGYGANGAAAQRAFRFVKEDGRWRVLGEAAGAGQR